MQCRADSDVVMYVAGNMQCWRAPRGPPPDDLLQEHLDPHPVLQAHRVIM